MAIIVEGLTRDIKRKIIHLVVDSEVKYFVVISALILSHDDFNLLLNRERRIALDIQKDGISLMQGIN